MSDLPPIGATVHNRGGGTGIVERRAAVLRRPDGTLSPPAAFVRWPEGGGAWFTANELEPAGDDGMRHVLPGSYGYRFGTPSGAPPMPST